MQFSERLYKLIRLPAIKQPNSSMPAIDIFSQLKESVCSHKVRPEDLSLLIEWPGVLILEFMTLTRRSDYKEPLIAIRSLLRNNASVEDLHNFFNDLYMAQAPTEEMLEIALKKIRSGSSERIFTKQDIDALNPEFLYTMALLLNPKSIIKGIQRKVYLLRSFLSNYFIICMMLMNCLENDAKETYITYEEIRVLLKKYNIGNNFTKLNYVTRMFHDSQALSSRRKVLKLKEYEKNTQMKSSCEEIEVPFAQMALRKILIENTMNEYAWIIKTNKSELKENSEDKVSGRAHQEKISSKSSVDMWYVFLSDNFEKLDEIDNSYFLVRHKEDTEDIFDSLFGYLYMNAMAVASIVEDIGQSWNDFLDKAEDIIPLEMINFDKWITSILDENMGSYELRESFFNFRGFSRIIGNLAKVIKNDDITAIDNKLDRAIKYHIRPKTYFELKKGHQELLDFISLVREKHKSKKINRDDSKQVANFFVSQKENYEYLSLLDSFEITGIRFKNVENATRQNRNYLLPILYKKLTRKDLGGSTLAKLLDVGTGTKAKKKKHFKFSKTHIKE